MYDTALVPSGLKITQRAILAQLNRSGPASVSALAEVMVMDAGGLAHTLKPLERDGFIRISVDPNDRRSRLLSLTSAGIGKLKETEAMWDTAQQDFEGTLGRKESALLHKLMSQLSSGQFAE
jgi:DNA-binding MarR family transcriptional regulator